MQGDSEKVARFHGSRRQRPIEHPGLVAQRVGAGRRHPDAALAYRIDFPIPPQRPRQQRHGLAVLGAECQHRVAVAAPPVALVLEAHAPGAHARRIENVNQADRGIGRSRARRKPEIDSFTAADDLQGVRQSRVLDAGLPVDGMVIDIEETLPRSPFRRAAAGCPRAFEVCVIDHCQSAVMAFQGKCDCVKECERRQQPVLPCQGLGRCDRDCRLVEQGEPAGPCQRYRSFAQGARLPEFRRIDNTHEQACAARRFRYPYRAAPHGQHTRVQGPGPAGFGQRGRTRKAAYKTRERVGNGGQPGIRLFRQFRRISLRQQGRRQAFEKGVRQPFGDQAERRAAAAFVFVRRDAEQQLSGFPAQQVPGGGLLHTIPEFDQEQMDRTPFDDPDTIRVVEPDGQVAGAGHGCAGARGQRRYRRIFRPRVLHQPDMTSL